MMSDVPSLCCPHRNEDDKMTPTTNIYNLNISVAEVKRVSGNLRCSNINGDMHTLLIGKCLTGAKSVR